MSKVIFVHKRRYFMGSNTIKLNFVVGPTGAGKTHFLRKFLKELPKK